ncbi:MAG: AAA family ATPase [Chloroflexota bacterium]|nr:AAA family ATPase [Chloroflexota bacterium]
MLKAISSTDFATMLNALARPDAFPCALPGEESISVIQTHASAVLLIADHVYKLKKPKDFGFFDYSTPALRRHFCGEEVRVNRRLAPHVYLGVAPVLEYTDGQFRFGPTFAPDDVPLPGCVLDGGYVVDYAVVMVRLPNEAMLECRVRAGTADASVLAEIARYVAAFHATTHAGEHIAGFGELDVIRGNWEENFEQMRPYVGRTLDVATYDRIVGYVHRFLEERAALFASRVRDGRIRDCHGDLRLQHIYILEVVDDQAQRLAVLDGIEFNERFRYSDVASEVAFLTMELDAAGRPDLARAFIEQYVAEAGDGVLRELLPFYACYRACVRGKVQSFQLDEPEVPETQRECARLQARLLFAQAAHYAGGPTRPALLLVGGLMGTGKSTLALALQRALGWPLFSSDTTRKRLAHLDPARPQADAFGQGMYGQVWTARTYQALLGQADAALAAGSSVLLDASFLRRADRQAAARIATAQKAQAFFVECACPREVALKRLAQRWKQRTEGSKELSEEAVRASDGRPDLYDAQSVVWEACDSGAEPHIKHLVMTTTLSLAVNVEQVLDALQMPRFACWL